jgi:chemotaxis protein MotB
MFSKKNSASGLSVKDTSKEDFSLCISDLMSALLMIFILVLILAVYTHQQMIRDRSAALEKQRIELAEKENSLNQQRIKLLEKDTRIQKIQKILDAKTVELNIKTDELEEKKRLVLEQEKLLEKGRSELAHLVEEGKIKQAELRKNEILLEESRRKLTIMKEQLTEKENKLFKQTRELSVKEKDLKKKEIELQAQKELLKEKNQRIREFEDTLKEQQRILKIQQLALTKNKEAALAAKKMLEEKEKLLNAQEKELKVQESSNETLKKELKAAQLLMSEQKNKIDLILGIRQDIIGDLKVRLGKIDDSLTLSVDPATGAIRLSGDVLFDYNSAEIKEEFEYRLKIFLDVYLRVLFENKRFRNSLAEIIIEGHADKKGSYMYNLDLSQRRAYAVMNFFLTKGPADLREDFKKYVTASGRSFSHVLKNKDGSVDDDKSRRIEVKFRLKDDKALMDLSRILEM